MRRVLLVNPWIHDFAAFDFWLKPLGLLRVTALLREAGAEVHLLDLLDRNHPWLPRYTKTDAWGRGKFYSEEIAKPKVLSEVPRKFKRYGLPKLIFEEKLPELTDADAVLLTSGMTYWYTGVTETVSVLRRKYSDVPFILGGVYATLAPSHARKHSGAELVIDGALRANAEALESLLGLRIPDNPILPAWDLYPKLDYAVISISKGCPFSCTYCASRCIEPRFIPARLEEALREVEWIVGLGIKRIAFYDDALLFHPQFDEIVKEMIGMGLELHTPNGLHVAQMSPERAELMKKAGFSSIYLSLETVDEQLLERTGTKVSPDAFKDAVTVLKDAGFSDELHAYVLFGLPGQSEESVKRTIDLALSLGVKPHLAEFSPVPGTVEFRRSGLSEDSDPLLTNNTYWCSRPCLGDSLERLKGYVRQTS